MENNKEGKSEVMSLEICGNGRIRPYVTCRMSKVILSMEENPAPVDG